MRTRTTLAVLLCFGVLLAPLPRVAADEATGSSAEGEPAPLPGVQLSWCREMAGRGDAISLRGR